MLPRLFERQVMGNFIVLCHVTHCIESIVLLAPCYRLPRHKCHYLPRLCVIGLQRYSSSSLAPGKSQDSVRSARLDPSGIPVLLHAEEEFNGVLLYAGPDAYSVAVRTGVCGARELNRSIHMAPRICIVLLLVACRRRNHWLFGICHIEPMRSRLN